MIPVIAHPERYRGMGERLRLAGMWRQEGAVLQMNHGSLVGRYGSHARSVAFRLLERGWVDCLASDFHGRPHLEVYLDKARDLFDKRGAGDLFELLASTNPDRIMNGDELEEVPPLQQDRRFLSRIKGLLGTE